MLTDDECGLECYYVKSELSDLDDYYWGLVGTLESLAEYVGKRKVLDKAWGDEIRRLTIAAKELYKGISDTNAQYDEWYQSVVVDTDHSEFDEE